MDYFYIHILFNHLLKNIIKVKEMTARKTTYSIYIQRGIHTHEAAWSITSGSQERHACLSPIVKLMDTETKHSTIN